MIQPASLARRLRVEVLVPAGLWLFLRLLPVRVIDEHRAAAAEAAERPGWFVGAAIVIMLWIGAALLLWHLIGWNRG